MLLLLQDAFVIAIVTFAVTVSLAQVFARQYSYSIDSNQVQQEIVITPIRVTFLEWKKVCEWWIVVYLNSSFLCTRR